MTGSDSVKEENQNNLLVDGKGMAGPNSVKKESQNNLLVDGKGMAGSNSVKKDSQTNLLVATLIATVTFTAAFTVPGGFQSQGVDEGSAVLSKRAAFHAFLIANTLAFSLSIASILVHFLASATITEEWCDVPLFSQTGLYRIIILLFQAPIQWCHTLWGLLQPLFFFVAS